MEDILREIDAALERRGISARAASIRAQGAPEMIRDMRRGHVPSVERLRSLCEVLGLEFYVGPPRWRRVEDGGALPDLPLRALEQSARDLVRLTVDAGGDPIPEDLWPELLARRRNERRGGHEDPPSEEARHDIVNFDVPFGSFFPGRVRAPLIGTPGGLPDEQFFPLAKPGRSYLCWSISDESAESLKAIGLFRFAGDEAAEAPAAFNEDIVRRMESDPAYLAYRDAPLRRGGDTARWTVVDIRDESMEPTLPNGGVVMVDGTSADWDPASIAVVRSGDDMLLRRVSIDNDGKRLLVCDHPDWPDEPWPSGARIVGQAKWAGHRLD